MRKWLEAAKPAASQQMHLLLAALMWSVVGTLLLAFGLAWTARSGTRLWPALIALALTAGVAKAHWILHRTARRIIDRIHTRGDGKCIGGFFSWRTWLFVALMSGSGRWLRGTPVSRVLVGLIYVAVGAALMLASRQLWKAWSAGRLPANSR